MAEIKEGPNKKHPVLNFQITTISQSLMVQCRQRPGKQQLQHI